MPDQIREAGPTIGGTPSATGRIEVTLITSGWGSSGYYSTQVLEQAAADRIFPAGTQCFVDHPGEMEQHDRPERSVRDLAAVLTEDARYDATDRGLVAEAQLLGPHVEVFADPDMANAIGMSIRASADVSMGEAEGRRGRIVGTLVEGLSVDFVTRAGRGGRYQLIESATPSRVVRQAIDRGVAEASANDLREWLGDALRDAYGGENSWAWVRDFDDSHVWYEHETPESSGLYQHTYDATDTAVTLTGDPVEVRVETRYVPVAPAKASPTTTPAEEGLVPELTEAEITQLRESAARAEAAEARLAESNARVAAIEARNAARPRVAALVAESQTLSPRTQGRLVESIVAGLPVVDGAIAEEALTAAVTAAVEVAEAEVADYGHPTLSESWGALVPGARDKGETTEVAEADALAAYDTASAAFFGRTVKGN